MRTEEDEAFDDLAKKQGDWGGGFPAKRKMAADKLQEPIYKITVFDNAHPKGIPLEDWVQPAQRPWVGLTDEEVNDCIKFPNRNLFARDGTTSQRIARATEAKLKEKNNGT